MRSLDSGRISAFAQFDTFRSSKSAFLTVWKAYIMGVLEGSSLGEDHRINNVLTKCSNQMIFFRDLCEGYICGLEASRFQTR